jgi:hypothetical protein
MSDSTHDRGRRQFMAGSAAIAGMASALIGIDSRAATTLEEWAKGGASILLHDPGLALSGAIRQRLDAEGARTIALIGDPVWLWRSDAGASLREPGTQLLGITGWAELLVFRGLAAETRRHLRHERLASDGVFIWLIA